MKEIRIKFNDGDLDKNQEITIIEQLYDAFRPRIDTLYLADLFSADLLNWVGGRIRADFPCNVMEYVKDATELRDEIDSLKKQLEDMEAREAKTRRAWGEERDVNTAHQARIRQLEEQVARHEADMDRLKNELEASEKAALLLKAKLWDLTTGKDN